MDGKIYDVIGVGLGSTGSALALVLARYTNITNVAYLEKYDKAALVNSFAGNNSQTHHRGDIETNIPTEKVAETNTASNMLVKIVESFSEKERKEILFPTTKMVLGIGEDQISVLEKRFNEIAPLFPKLQLLDRKGIAHVEPAVVEGRSSKEKITALYNTDGFAVNFEVMSETFLRYAQKECPTMNVMFNCEVEHISKLSSGIYRIKLESGQTLFSRVVIMNTDSYSLYFAKQLGLAKEYSLIPIAASFFTIKRRLHGKVYTVQNPKLPFAAVHGDPDVRFPGITRLGPTALLRFVLEGSKKKTFFDYLRSSGLNRLATWISFFVILLDPVRFCFLLKNMMYDLPLIGKRLFLGQIRKIIPLVKLSEVSKIKSNGMRQQRVNTKTHELQLGTGKIVDDNIIFNMTPSPGASKCVFNAYCDAVQIIKFLGSSFTFYEQRLKDDLMPDHKIDHTFNPSIPHTYVA